MTTLELSLLSTELTSARVNATLGASHVDQVRRTASINAGGNAGINIRPLHLAVYHFNEAAKLIDQALGNEPMPAAPSMADYIAAAKQGSVKVGSVAPRGPLPENNESSVTLAPSAQDAPAASSTLSPSPETENMGSADNAPSREEAPSGEGELSISQAATSENQ